MIQLRRWLRGLYHAAKLAVGWVEYLVFDRTAYYAHQSMIALFCLTKGYSNDFLSAAIGFAERRYRFADAVGVLGDMREKRERKRVVSVLRERGYYIFENRLPADLCDRLLAFAVSHPCKMRRMDGDKLGSAVSTTYHRDLPQAVRYDFDTRELLDNPDIQLLMADLSMAAIAQDYLGSRPVLDVLSMWWHTSFGDRPDSEAGQYFHFDMDRPKWLKVFIYLTDVGPASGPHSFISGSHRSGKIPSALLEKGYARITDEEIGREFAREDIVEMAAPRGTIIVEDTRGFHKGKHVTEGDRLMLQLQFSNSLFGGFYPKVSLKEDLCFALKNRIARFPNLYKAYL